MTENVLLTGCNGTIGIPLKKHLQSVGYKVICWNKNQIPTDNYNRMFAFVSSVSPAILIHLAAITSFSPEKRQNAWQVNVEWPSELAWICREMKIKFIFISSALVYSPQVQGPFYPDTIPDATEGYGYEKRKAEEKVLSQYPGSLILRLGWQIAIKGSNSMITHFETEFKNNGFINASTKFFPSCSFVEDTVKVIEQVLNFAPGVYQVNSNSRWNLYEIVNGLNRKYNRSWVIRETEQPQHDQRMFDNRISIPGLEYQLIINH